MREGGVAREDLAVGSIGLAAGLQLGQLVATTARKAGCGLNLSGEIGGDVAAEAPRGQ